MSIMLYWIAKVLAKTFKGESDIRPGKDIYVYQASNTLLVLFGIGAFVIWSNRAETVTIHTITSGYCPNLLSQRVISCAFC